MSKTCHSKVKWVCISCTAKCSGLKEDLDATLCDYDIYTHACLPIWVIAFTGCGLLVDFLHPCSIAVSIIAITMIMWLRPLEV